MTTVTMKHGAAITVISTAMIVTLIVVGMNGFVKMTMITTDDTAIKV